MNKIIAVALNTFLETRRDKILYSFFVFAIIMILSSLVFSTLSAEQYPKIVKDFGLTAISLFSILISIFLGTGLVYKEIEKKTVYNIFSKPIERYQFLTGKYLGIAITILVIMLLMSLIFLGIVLLIQLPNKSFIEYYYGGLYFNELFAALYFEYLECLVVIGIAILFSCFTSPVLALLFTFLIFAIGRFSSDIKLFAKEIDNNIVSKISDVLYYTIPNLEKFNIRSEAVYGGNISLELILNTTAYALIFSLILLLLSIVVFQRKEFK